MNELPWAADLMYLGGDPLLPQPGRATVRLDPEGISLHLGENLVGWYADEIERVTWRQSHVALFVNDGPGFHPRLQCDDYYAAAVFACLASDCFGAILEQLPPYAPPALRQRHFCRLPQSAFSWTRSSG